MKKTGNMFQRLVNNIETHVQESGRVLAIYFCRQGIGIFRVADKKVSK